MLKELINEELRKKQEFRYHNVPVSDKKGRIRFVKHPCYIFLENDDLYLYVTLTHSQKVGDYLVILLRKNPNPNDKRESYYVAEVRVDKKIKFDRFAKKWELDPLDDEDIRKLYKDFLKKDN